ncbi:MAG: formate/nitrite transporter family protein [Pseudomonadota bacterium]|nr:formate/nitrite transporter family protein [Pseudomonadota bacterium]
MDVRKPQSSDEQEKEIAEAGEAHDRSAPGGMIVYKAILLEGEEELARSSAALFWSGIAAGLSMGLSMIAEALLQTHLPDAEWRPLVSKLGYSAGFLVVILGRQQLFTENTLTPILPLLARRPKATPSNVLRLWAIVLVGNLLGGLVLALVAAHTSAFDPDVQSTFMEMGEKALDNGVVTVLVRGVFAGWMIALMVWLLPFAETGRVGVIIIVTYLVGLGEFSHVIAGSIEVFTLCAIGEASWLDVIGTYVLPTLIGNIVGGVTLVAMLNHAQVTAGGDNESVSRDAPAGARTS